MLLLTIWALIGVLISGAAAKQRGFAMVGAVMAGILLGPLSIVMFFSSRVSPAERVETCPPPTPQQTPRKHTAALPGTGRGFFVEVSGESFYQTQLRALQAVAGDQPVRVLVVPEPDNPYDAHAVAIKNFEGETLGYLTRADASRYQPTLLALLNDGRTSICSGRLTGGSENKPTIGLCLDIEAPPKVAKEFGVTDPRATSVTAVPTRAAEPTARSSAPQENKTKELHELDPHGQPFNVLFNRAGRTERDLSELLGLAKAMLSDGVVNEAEATYLRIWGENHSDALAQWPTKQIFARLDQYFVDGRIDEAERIELQDLLAALVGGKASLLLGCDGATTLPLDNPTPPICWGPNEVYVFTGRFAYGTRAACEREVTRRGASCEPRVTQRTSFMVIGTFGSRDWAHSSYGRKIQQAVKLRESGLAIRIVGEDHWATALALTAEEPPLNGARQDRVRGSRGDVT